MTSRNQLMIQNPDESPSGTLESGYTRHPIAARKLFFAAILKSISAHKDLDNKFAVRIRTIRQSTRKKCRHAFNRASDREAGRQKEL